MLKLNLQYFADESFEPSVETDTSTDTMSGSDATETRDTRSFEEMYEYGRPEEKADTTETELEEVATETTETPNVETAVDNRQDFKNEQNARFATQRRQQEEAARIQASRDEVIREMFQGQVNPYTNKPVTTEREYREYQQQLHEDQIKQAGFTQEQFNEIVQQNPQVQQARQIIQQNEELQRQASLQRGQQQLNDELKIISKLDPSIKTIDDLKTAENFNQVLEKVKAGYSLVDAYRVVNFDALTKQKQDAARQRAINQVAGKQHLQATGGNSGGNDVSVPKEIMDYYREFMPKATTKQINEHYKKHMKG